MGVRRRLVETLRVEVAVPLGGGVTELGFRRQVLPGGHPETLRLTLLLKLFTDPTVTEYVVLDPREIVWLDGVAEMVKSGGGALEVTTNCTVVLWTGLPVVSVPVIVRV